MGSGSTFTAVATISCPPGPALRAACSSAMREFSEPSTPTRMRRETDSSWTPPATVLGLYRGVKAAAMSGSGYSDELWLCWFAFPGTSPLPPKCMVGSRPKRPQAEKAIDQATMEDESPPQGGPPGPAHPAVVTVAALHGAGGSLIGPRVAERLGVRFLDRAISRSVAERAGLSEHAADAIEEAPRSATDRLVRGLARVANSSTASEQQATRVEFEDRRLRAEIEEFLSYAALSGGVVLGRGGAVVLADVPSALHVYLGGPKAARVQTIMELEGVDRVAAERDVTVHDRARRDFVQEAYGVNGDDPGLYDLMVDATAFGVDACVELIVAASGFRSGSGARKGGISAHA